MAVRTARASWQGPLVEGAGEIALTTSGLGPFPTSLTARAADQTTATGPEELLAAAHAGCYAMQLSALLTEAGAPPQQVEVDATVTQGGPEADFGIVGVRLEVAVSAELADDRVAELAQEAGKLCPVSRALSVPIEVSVRG